jgi:hypothetical protein
LALSLLPREEEENDKNKKPEENAKAKLAGEGGFLCPSKVAYGKIKKAKSSTNGKWKWIVNYAEHTQTLRIEKCLLVGNISIAKEMDKTVAMVIEGFIFAGPLVTSART